MRDLPTLKVTTNHSEYVIDQNAGTFTRSRVADNAADLGYAGITETEKIPYSEIMCGLKPGEQLVIILPDNGWIRSTLVQSVEELVV